jgi:hypothetical protein
MTTEYDILAIKGNCLNLRFVASNTNGTPIDLTQYVATGFVRLSYSSTGVLLDLQPVVHSSYVSGLIDVTISASGLEDLPITEAIYDIKIYNITGCSAEVVRGHFDIYPAGTV